jgi:hypothetical protein
LSSKRDIDSAKPVAALKVSVTNVGIFTNFELVIYKNIEYAGINF